MKRLIPDDGWMDGWIVIITSSANHRSGRERARSQPSLSHTLCYPPKIHSFVPSAALHMSIVTYPRDLLPAKGIIKTKKNKVIHEFLKRSRINFLPPPLHIDRSDDSIFSFKAELGVYARAHSSTYRNFKIKTTHPRKPFFLPLSLLPVYNNEA